MEGESDREEFEANVRAEKRENWPGAMLDMYLGLVAADEVKAAAQRDTNGEKSKRECKANFSGRVCSAQRSDPASEGRLARGDAELRTGGAGLQRCGCGSQAAAPTIKRPSALQRSASVAAPHRLLCCLPLSISRLVILRFR